MKCNPPMVKTFSPEVTDLILSLLTRDPLQRLGANGASEVKNHTFFRVSFVSKFETRLLMFKCCKIMSSVLVLCRKSSGRTWLRGRCLLRFVRRFATRWTRATSATSLPTCSPPTRPPSSRSTQRKSSRFARLQLLPLDVTHIITIVICSLLSGLLVRGAICVVQ